MLIHKFISILIMIFHNVLKIHLQLDNYSFYLKIISMLYHHIMLDLYKVMDTNLFLWVQNQLNLHQINIYHLINMNYDDNYDHMFQYILSHQLFIHLMLQQLFLMEQVIHLDNLFHTIHHHKQYVQLDKVLLMD